ncbi:MAG: hypothetical protein WAR37_03560 [Candidatus Microsaccharimonas sp.]
MERNDEMRLILRMIYDWRYHRAVSRLRKAAGRRLVNSKAPIKGPDFTIEPGRQPNGVITIQYGFRLSNGEYAAGACLLRDPEGPKDNENAEATKPHVVNEGPYRHVLGIRDMHELSNLIERCRTEDMTVQYSARLSEKGAQPATA